MFTSQPLLLLPASVPPQQRYLELVVAGARMHGLCPKIHSNGCMTCPLLSHAGSAASTLTHPQSCWLDLLQWALQLALLSLRQCARAKVLNSSCLTSALNYHKHAVKCITEESTVGVAAPVLVWSTDLCDSMVSR